MATRLLLTLLALLTGLSAQLSPAQARVCAGVDTEIGEVASPHATQRRCNAIALICPPIERQASRDQTIHGFVPTSLAPATPGVLQGIDRARE